MEIQHLKYFYEVAKRGSFSAAAKTLRVSQPSISKMVKQLEDLEGYVFLERGKSGVKLTPMGRLLFERCERIFIEFDGLKVELTQRKEECQGELWFGASDNLLNYLLPGPLKVFLTNNPKVQAKLFSGTSSQIIEQLKDYALELALFYTPVKDPSLTAEKIRQVEFLAVHAKKISPADLRSTSFVGSFSRDYQHDYPALRLLKDVGIQPTSMIESNLLETQKQLVLSGIGFSLLPEHMVRSEIKSGQLHTISLKRKLSLPVYLVYRKKRSLSPVASAWAHCLKKALGQF